MRQFYETIKKTLEQGQNIILVSVVSSLGSTPRGNGARMVVFENGTTLGTIGGGAVEHAGIRVAKEALQLKKSFIQGFDLSHGDAASIGMICGGKVTVCFQFIEAHIGFESIVDAILELLNQNSDSWMITEIIDGVAGRTGVYDDYNGLRFLPQEILPKIKNNFGSQSVWTKGEISYFIDPLTTAGYAYIFGGGHVAQALVPVIAGVGFKPIVYEDRVDFAKPELFEGVWDTVLGDYTKIGEHISIGCKDYVIIMTRGHQSDFEVLSEVLKSQACYIGVMGSKTKIAVTNQRLLACGFHHEDIGRIHTPIGLAIKACTPAEIAISVAAELILHRAQLKE